MQPTNHRVIVGALVMSNHLLAEIEGQHGVEDEDGLSDTTLLISMWVAPDQRWQGRLISMESFASTIDAAKRVRR